MIVAKRLLRPFLRSIRAASVVNNIKQKASAFMLNSPESGESPKLKEFIDTLKNVNYRYEYPQNLTEEQKETMKRFDIFR